jgi:hypothetical protein
MSSNRGKSLGSIVEKLRRDLPIHFEWAYTFVKEVYRRRKTRGARMPSVRDMWPVFARQRGIDPVRQYVTSLPLGVLLYLGFRSSSTSPYEVSSQFPKDKWISDLYDKLDRARKMPRSTRVVTAATAAATTTSLPPVPVRKESLQQASKEELVCLVRDVAELERLKERAVREALEQCNAKNQAIIDDLRLKLASVPTPDIPGAKKKLSELEQSSKETLPRVQEAAKPESLLEQIRAGKALKKVESGAAEAGAPAKTDTLEEALRKRIERQRSRIEPQEEESTEEFKGSLIIGAHIDAFERKIVGAATTNPIGDSYVIQRESTTGKVMYPSVLFGKKK